MDGIFNGKHEPWGLLINSCLKTTVDDTRAVNGDNQLFDELKELIEEYRQDKCVLERWKPYYPDEFERKITVALHISIVSTVVAPQVINELAKEGVRFDREHVMRKVLIRKTADTSEFNQKDADTDMNDLVIEMIMRITCLCTAFMLYQIFEKEEIKNSKQILVDTLNVEVPHLNKLSGQIFAFRDKFWKSEISKACGEYIADHADELPHLTLSEQQAKKKHIVVLEPEQLQLSLDLAE